METRIKYIKKNSGRWYYAIQVKKHFLIKKWTFWKTIELCSTWLAVENFFKEMEKIDDYNVKLKLKYLNK